MIDEAKTLRDELHTEGCRLCIHMKIGRCAHIQQGKTCNTLYHQAANLIESLAAELEQVKQERDGLNILLAQAQSMLETRTHERDVLQAEIDDFNAQYLSGIQTVSEPVFVELNRVKRERDAAVKDLTTYCQTCWTCLFESKGINEEPCESCEDIRRPFVRKNWQWRGVKED